MKTINICKQFVYRIGCLLVMPAYLCGCIYEHPQLTDEGKSGIDPTEVNVNLDIEYALKQRDTEDGYCHRIIVDAYIGRELVSRKTIYQSCVKGAEKVEANVNLKLHARDYRLLVWADYVKSEDKADFCYNTATLVPVVGMMANVGNSEYKDSCYGNQELLLSEFRDEWGKKERVAMELKRPTMRYELVANDAQAFLQKINNGKVTGKKFTVTVRYTDFFYTGFNALDEITKNALKYITYSNSIGVPQEGTEDLSLAFDYVFVPTDGSDVPLSVEVTNESGTLISRTYTYLKGGVYEDQIIRGNFLTSNPSAGGISIDSDYDGVVEDEIEVE